MSSVDTRLKFSIEGLSDIKSQTNSVIKEMLSQQQNQTKSGQDLLKLYQDQIAALTKRNQLAFEAGRANIRSQYNAGVFDKEGVDVNQTLKEKLGENSAAFEAEKVQLKVLQDILLAITMSSKEEGKDFDALAKELKERYGEDIDIESFKDLYNSLDKEATGDDSRKDSKGRKGSDILDKFFQGLSFQNLLNNPLQTPEFFSTFTKGLQNVGGALTNASWMTAIAGLPMQLTGQVLEQLTNTSKPYEKSIGKSIGQFGGSRSDYDLQGGGMSKYGYNMQQYLDSAFGVSRAMGGYSTSGIRSSLMMQRGSGLGEGDITSLYRAGRGQWDQLDPRNLVQSVIQGMQASGASRKGDLSLLPEYMSILTSTSQKQLETLGRVDIGVNTKMINAIASSSSTFANPDVLKNVMQQLQQGLTQSSTPQVEALQFQALSSIKPGATLWDLEKMKENPFSEESKDYLPKFVDLLKSNSIDQQDFARNIKNIFGTSANIADELAKIFGKEGWLDFWQKKLGGQEKIDIEGRTEQATPFWDKEEAKKTNAKITATSGMVNDIAERVFEFQDEMLKKVDNMPRLVGEEVKNALKLFIQSW